MVEGIPKGPPMAVIPWNAYDISDAPLAQRVKEAEHGTCIPPRIPSLDK